jgi:hypothetical protein
MGTKRNLDKTVPNKELELRTRTILYATSGSTRAFTGKKILQQSLPASQSISIATGIRTYPAAI